MKTLLTIGFGVGLILTSASCQTHQPSQKDYLTNDRQGKYWDIVYSTSVSNVINHSYRIDDAAYKSLIYNCDYFYGINKVIHYRNIDSIKVIDRGYNTDIVYNPDEFSLTDSTLFFSGHKHKILTLNKNVMVLEYEYEHKKSIKIYIPSLNQHKAILNQ